MAKNEFQPLLLLQNSAEVAVMTESNQGLLFSSVFLKTVPVLLARA